MLLTALALSVVASLFWQQQVQVRSIDNQRLQLQKQWVLRGAFDWAGDELGEEADEDEIVDRVAAGAELAPVHVDGVAHRLEGVEGDAIAGEDADVPLPSGLV